MNHRFLPICLILLLAVSCSQFTGPEQDHAQQPLAKPVQTPQQWFLHRGGLGEPFAWISGKSGRYPVRNYRLNAVRMANAGWWTEGDSVDLLIELPRPLTGEDLTLDFPEVRYRFHRTVQPEITFQVKVNGRKLTSRTAKLPKIVRDRKPEASKLKLSIPARFTNSHRIRITFEFQGLHTAAEMGGKGMQKLGIGFLFLKPDSVKDQIGHAVFLVKNAGPVKDGRQAVELSAFRTVSGMAFPDPVNTELDPAAAGTPDGFRPDDLVDLAIQQEKDGWTVLYGGLSPIFRPGQLPHTSDPLFYYCPKKLPMSNPPLTDSAVDAQKKQILGDLKEIRSWIKEYRRDLAREERLQREWLQRQKGYQLIPKVISPETGQEVERFQNHFYWGKNSGAFFALAKDHEFKRPASGIVNNIGALNALHQLLKSCNIQLIVVLVPDPEHLAAGMLLFNARTADDPVAVQCAASLLEYGIETIHSEPSVKKAGRAAERLYLYPSPVPGTDLWMILTDLTADRLTRFGEKAFVENPPVHYRMQRAKTVFGDNCRWPEGVDCGEHQEGEVAEGRLVLRDGQSFQPDPASKILVIGGDSLNLPGPDHTFTGMLSMRLKYAVDELIPGKEAWLHNLPLMLQSDPVRWLGGKQVCLMMVSPRMLENEILPNLRTESELFAKLRRQKLVHQYKLPPKKAEIVLPEPVPNDRRFALKKLWNRFWSQFNGTPFMIEEDEQTLTVSEFSVPEKLTGAPFIFLAETMGYPEQAVTMIVNGRKVPLPEETYVPYSPRPAVGELPAGTTSIKLEFSGRRGDLIRIRKIQLYR